MMTYAPFAADHAPALSADPHWLQAAPTFVPYPSWAALDDGVPVAAGGVMLLWSGVAEAWWRLGANYQRRHTPAVVRTAWDTMLDVIRQHDLHRLQAVVHANDGPSLRFAHWFGMRPEGLMRGYGRDRSDFFRYAWVRA